MLGCYEDITRRKKAEEELRQHRDHLESLVAQRTAALEQRTAELSEMNRELESFSYSVSHDLRAPLRSIGGFSQAILEDFSNELNPTGKDYLQRVCAASQRMGELIDDLLMLSRVTRREMNDQSIDLSGMAREIADGLKETQPGRDVEFNIQNNLQARGDEKLLRIAVENLLANAWKYTRNRNKAVIEFGTVIRAGEKTYCVRDNGAGFDMRYAHKLFTPFQRLHSQCEFEGTGIGLATVQRVVGRHRGRIWSEAQVDRGASFYFQLPAEGS